MGLVFVLGLASCGGGEDTVPTPTPAPVPNPNSGLNSRPANDSCAVQAPGNATQWFVLQQGGVIHRFANRDSTTASTVFVEVNAMPIASSIVDAAGATPVTNWANSLTTCN